ncbi:MAG: hypothetical protein KQH53_08380 [Desulfarculaceae bacterium]|nr:hypothetical protein [Desulfarculaceae bacterium]
MRGLFVSFLKAYIDTVFSFSIFQIMLFKFDDNAFNITNKSGSIFLDFLYYNIVTVATIGYGDIVPVSIAAKLLCILEIFLGILVLGTIIILIIWRYQNIVLDKDNISRDD